MNGVLKAVCFLSLSGSVLIMILLLGRPVVKNRVSRQWQYYIWLLVIARLLVPFTPPENLTGTLSEQARQKAAQIFSIHENAEDSVSVPDFENQLAADAGSVTDLENQSAQVNDTAQQMKNSMAQAPFKNAGKTVLSYCWLVWLGVALLLLVRKITAYQSFTVYLKAGREEVSDTGRLDRLAQTGEQMGVKRPVELYENRLVSSPMLSGFFRPCIVLPDAGLPDDDFEYTVRHELVHYKRMDLLYKWLVQITVCLHWFNPLVWLMSREVNRACELACDEAVMQKLNVQQRRAYGDTLLRAAGTGRTCKKVLTSVMLSEDAQLLKERLDAVMKFKKSSKLSMVFSAALTAVMLTGATAAGAVIPSKTAVTSAGSVKKSVSSVNVSDSSTVSRAEKYYKNGSLALFASEFSDMDETTQKTWLNKIYKDGKTAFFSASLQQLDEDSPLAASFAKKAYKDKNISFFSVLADLMDKKTLETWLEKAEKDKRSSFQSVLLKKLDWDWELDKLEAKLEKERLAEYKEHGITKNGKKYYYKGKLVNIFMDVKEDSSFYMLDMNPKGSINIKVTRGADNKIQSVKRMSESEAAKLLGGWEDDEEKDDGMPVTREITVPVNIDKVKNGEFIWLGTYDLAEKDRVFYHVSAKTGKRLDIGFARPEDETPDTVYHQVSNLRENGRLEIESGSMAWKVEPGTYCLYVHTKGGRLTGVRGYVTITKYESE